MGSIRITATSHILPGSPAWSSLAPYGELAFGEYGDWPSVLISSETNPLVWFLFLGDVVDASALDQADADEFDRLLEPIFSILLRRLEAVDTPLVLAWSAWMPGSMISAARSRSPWGALTRHLEMRLYELAAHRPALHLLGLDEVFARIGFRTTFDSRNFYAARCRLSSAGLRQAVEALACLFERFKRPARKVLVLDCDNTLWQGVVGEVGLAGIGLGLDGLGKAFTDFQKVAQALSRQGVLLALASKNNEAEVWEVFERHPGMVLKRSDIIAWRINWQEKAANIASMAEELSLAPDAFVFWDDNPLEREKVKLALPAVATIDAPADVTLWPDILRSLDALANFTVTAEDRRKTEQYKSRADFVGKLRAAPDEQSFLRSIALRPASHGLDETTALRAEQLCAKTNQFNLRAVRHSASELNAFAENFGAGAFVVRLADRFGDHGIVGLVLAMREGEIAFLDTFLMSCRVLGRRLEAWMLAELVARLRDAGCRKLIAEFVPTQRNTVAAEFLPMHGLTPWSVDALAADEKSNAIVARLSRGGKTYCADLDNLVIPFLEVFPNGENRTDGVAEKSVS